MFAADIVPTPIVETVRFVPTENPRFPLVVVGVNTVCSN